MLGKLLKSAILLSPVTIAIRSIITNPAKAILDTLEDLNNVVDGKPIGSIKKLKLEINLLIVSLIMS